MPVPSGGPSQTELPVLLQNPQVPKKLGSRDGGMTGTTTPNKPLTVDLSLSFQTCIDATSPERQQDIRRFIEASSLDGTHPTLPPLQLVFCLPLSALRGTRPRLLRLCPTQRQGHPPFSQTLTRAHLPCRPPSDWTVRKSSKPRRWKELPADGEATHPELRGPECLNRHRAPGITFGRKEELDVEPRQTLGRGNPPPVLPWATPDSPHPTSSRPYLFPSQGVALGPLSATTTRPRPPGP